MEIEHQLHLGELASFAFSAFHFGFYIHVFDRVLGEVCTCSVLYTAHL